MSIEVNSVSKGLVNERGAADYLGMNIRTIQSWRQQHKGPRFIRIGTHVRYRIEDLEQFVISNAVEPQRAAGKMGELPNGR